MDFTTTELNGQLALLKASLQQMRLPFEEQKINLAGSVVEDEVVLDFSNSFLLLPNLIEAGRLSSPAIASILRVFNKMEYCLNNIGLKDFDAPEWNEVRELAAKALIDIEIS